MIDVRVNDAERHHEAIVGLERRLEREELSGRDTTIARIVLMQHYAAYAAAIVQHKTRGSVEDMKNATDRNNMIPLSRLGRKHPLD